MSNASRPSRRRPKIPQGHQCDFSLAHPTLRVRRDAVVVTAARGVKNGRPGTRKYLAARQRSNSVELGLAHRLALAELHVASRGQLGGEAKDLDEALGVGLIEAVPGVVGGEVEIVQRGL